MPRLCQEHFFHTSDKQNLFYRYWPSPQKQRKGIIVLFHRGHEHSGRMAHLVDELNLDEYDFFAWDARGHGKSPGQRGYSPHIGRSIQDIDEFITHIQTQHHATISEISLIAQSVGAVLASAWVHDYAPKIRCMILASPAFKVKLYVPFARTGLKLLQAIRGSFFVNSYVKAKFLTHDPERIASYTQDPLITRPIASHILLELYETAERLIADAAAIHIPTQLLISESDWVVHHAPQHHFFDRLGSHTKEKHSLAGFYHDTLGERDRMKAIEYMRPFLQKAYEHPIAMPSLLSADARGYTYNEFQALSQPLPLFSWKKWNYKLTQSIMNTLGAKLSQGINIGAKTGFDSGSMLDYVYQNKPTGQGIIGQFIDYCYLNSIGWRGIRQRKVHLETFLNESIHTLAERTIPIHIVDIAAGHGRYVLEVIEKSAIKPNSVTLRDYSPLNIKEGNTLIAQKNMPPSVRFEQGDAFDRTALTHLSPAPTLAIVSGLYELFPQNTLIQESLAGLAASMPAGAFLIYTNQPWHPQLEFIARVLTSHRQHQSWVMRRRTQMEMDQLIEQAGFTKIKQLIDKWGIFSVSVAQRR